MSIRKHRRGAGIVLSFLLSAGLVASAGPASAGGDPPVADDDGPFAVDEDAASPLSVAAPGVLDGDTDADLDTLSAVLVSDVTNGTLALSADGSFTYTPDPDFNGADSFTYTAIDDPDPDATPSNVATVTITVNPVEDAPVAVDDTASFDEDAGPQFLPVLDNDDAANPDAGEDLDLTAVDPGTLGTTLIVGDQVKYTPNTNATGQDVFTYTVTDGSSTDVGQVTVTLGAQDDGVAAVPDAATTDEDTAVPIDVKTNDDDADGDGVVSIKTDPLFGDVVLNGSVVTYTPDPDWSGEDTFEYTLTNTGILGGSSDALVTVTVNAVNDPPVAADDSVDTTVDVAVGPFAVLGNDSDVEPGLLDVIAKTDPEHGDLIHHGDDTFTYTPDPGYQCGDSFTYTVADTGVPQEFDSATVRLRVQGPTTVTLARGALTIGYGKTVSITAGLPDHAMSTSDQVEIWRQPDGGAWTLMATGTVNGSGKFTATSPALFKDQFFQVRFAGDDCFLPVQGTQKEVRVRARATSTMYACTDPSRPPGGCYYALGGVGLAYRLFHITAPRDPLYEVKVIPNHAGIGTVKIELQKRANGVWATIGTFDGYALDPDSVFGAGMPANTIGAYRVRGIWSGDDNHASATAPWMYFKITA